MDLLAHPRAKELVAVRIAQLTAIAVADGTSAPTATEISRQLRVPAQMVIEIIQLLVESKLVVMTRRGGLSPSKDIAELNLADVSAAVGGLPRQLRRNPDEPRISEFQEVERLFTAIDEARVVELSHVSWANLARSRNP